MNSIILRAENISKSFGRNRVLSAVTFEAGSGRIHALVGENGAGKSTLINIFGGLHRPDEGSIYINGSRVALHDPLQAIRRGISIVHQEFSLFPNLTVAQNIFSHRERVNALGIIRWPQVFADGQTILQRMGIELDPATLVGDLTVGMQQVVEIGKALSQNARVLILDEPTAALSEHEVERLFAIVHDLKMKGVSVVFVSHKLGEVFAIADDITVLRDGVMVGKVEAQSTSRDQIVRMMVGRHIDTLFPPRGLHVGEGILTVNGLTRPGFFSDVSFTLRKGEILGFAGLIGSGRTEVARALFGADGPVAGDVLLNGRNLRVRSPGHAIDNGICYLTEDRKNLGLFLHLSVRSNIIAAALKKFLSRGLFIRKQAVRNESASFLELMEIRPVDDSQELFTLSGGNQQKVLLAKWLSARPQVLIVDEPTRGVDVGAKAKIHNELRRLAEGGIGVILISSELPEVMGLSDRIAVFREGRIAGMLSAERVTQEDVMKLATS